MVCCAHIDPVGVPVHTGDGVLPLCPSRCASAYFSAFPWIFVSSLGPATRPGQDRTASRLDPVLAKMPVPTYAYRLRQSIMLT